MAGNFSISDGGQKIGQRPTRAWRPWFWGIALWLRNGSLVIAFYLAARTSTVGMLALVAFVGSLFLRVVLEATSEGD